MTTRALLLPALFVALFAASYSPVRSELPQAPAPRVKKSTAELLVGTWKQVKFMNKPPLGENLMGFTADGKYFARLTSPRLGVRITTGSYSLIGKSIRLTSDANDEGPSKSWDVVIEAISAEELTVVAGPLNGRQRSVLIRMKSPGAMVTALRDHVLGEWWTVNRLIEPVRDLPANSLSCLAGLRHSVHPGRDGLLGHAWPLPLHTN